MTLADCATSAAVCKRCVVCRHLLLKAVAGSHWIPGLSSLAEFAFSMIEGMQSYYTYVES
jgi:hypothetical protein